MAGNAFARFVARFETVVVGLMQVLLMLAIALAVGELFWLLATRTVEIASDIESVPDLQRAVQNAFAGVLLVILGLELLDSIRTFHLERRVRLEIILVVATIALARHIIQLDFEHTSGATLAGIAALALSLTAGYWLARRGAQLK